MERLDTRPPPDDGNGENGMKNELKANTLGDSVVTLSGLIT